MACVQSSPIQFAKKLTDSVPSPLWYPTESGTRGPRRKRASMRSLLGPRTVGVMLFLSGQAAMAQSHPYPECTAEPTESDIAAAKGAFQAGQVSFNEADYDRTI